MLCLRKNPLLKSLKEGKERSKLSLPFLLFKREGFGSKFWQLCFEVKRDSSLILNFGFVKVNVALNVEV